MPDSLPSKFFLLPSLVLISIIDEILPKQVIPFKKARTVIDQSLFNPIHLDYIPTSGDKVVADNGNGYKLGKKIAEGGEGAIYQFSQIINCCWKKTSDSVPLQM